MRKGDANRQHSTIHKTPAMLRKEAELGRPLEKVMSELWAQEGSQAKAAKVLGIPADTFFNWSHMLHLSKRTVIERN